ncbi:hypothetical protein BS614_24010 [Paenibacillus xylanexedens]|uniref:hypothetical protein n=1 Tax=Paenibacillus xylanexedens TaxID=528191 RepID=UPI0009383002|nr:hypothetical protein [Paenibacillus xylanexedens]APO46804.1 hypothetical protein BS614_24010 [Paenibacillus xylanexedens]
MTEFSLNFKYKFTEDYNPVYINGAQGGLSPNGEFVINFYMERHPLPYSETRDLNDDGTLSANVRFEPEEHNLNIMRFIQTGIVMNKETAASIHSWLGNMLESLEQSNREGG